MDGVDIKRVMKKIYLKLWSIPGKPGSGVTRLVETPGQKSERQAELLRPEVGLGRAETGQSCRPTEDGRDGHVVSHVLSLGKLSCIVQMRTDLFNVILEITQGRN